MRPEILPAGRNQYDGARVFGVHAILPSQLGPRRITSGVRALYVEVLREALREAGVVRSHAPLHPRRQALAVAWLTGTLDDQVAVPVGFVCDALGSMPARSPPPCAAASHRESRRVAGCCSRHAPQQMAG